MPTKLELLQLLSKEQLIQWIHYLEVKVEKYQAQVASVVKSSDEILMIKEMMDGLESVSLIRVEFAGCPIHN